MLQVAMDGGEYLAVFSIGSIRIGVPQKQVHTLESVSDVRAGGTGQAVGIIELDHGTWPIFSLSEDLAPLAEIPAGRRLCALMGEADLRFGIACDAFASVPVRQLRTIPVPASVARAGSPIGSFAIHQNAVVGLSAADALAGFLIRQGTLAPPVPAPAPVFDRVL